MAICFMFVRFLKCKYQLIFIDWINESSSLHKLSSFLIKIFKDFFLRWIIFKVFIEFVTISLLFHVLAFWPQVMWDLISPTRGRTHTLCIGRQTSSFEELSSWLIKIVWAEYCFSATYTRGIWGLGDELDRDEEE